MAQRITENDLKMVCLRLNKLTGSPEKPYAIIDGKNKAQIGNYHISHAYGGVCLHRMFNEGGAVTSVLSCGHIPKKELYYLMHAYIAGLEAKTCLSFLEQSKD